ncbi:MAG: endolytic transglycosylase MltG [Flavobacteriales bacterium]|nr:endolytic transglycosylase MltG [Flavobacteriales bacterium]
MKKVSILFIILALIGAWWAWDKYDSIRGKNVSIDSGEIEFFIYHEDTYEGVEAKLIQLGIIDNIDSFIWVAEKKSYPDLVKPGRYILKDGMSNNDLVDLLRAGKQIPLNVSFNNVRNLPQLAGRLSQKLEADSIDFLSVLTSDELIEKYGFERETFISMFIPNTYEMYWTITPEAFVKRMASEFKKFWNDSRIAKAKALGLSQSEIVTIASIVQAEQSLRPEEWPTIAGLYLNRVKRGMKLESDPTVIFAVGDFGIRRVLNKHLKVDSPYNTYKVKGLPPGPIRMPDVAAVDAVLSAEDHDYIFMCAKADLSGYHHFSETLRQHNRYAREYRRTMNNSRIYK